MFYTSQSADFPVCANVETSQEAKSGRRKDRMLRNVLGSISKWDQKRSDEEIGRLLDRHGGRFTDDLERRMMRHAAPSCWGGDS